VNSSPVNVGVKFRSDFSGFISGMQFYKGAGNNGTHTASLYNSAGALLAQAAFSGESASGWQHVSFAAPVSIAANTTYVASLFTTSGFAVDYSYFAGKGVDSAPLHALASGVDGANGVYAYGAGPQFPTFSYADSNYWVDVTFTSSGGLALALACPASNGLAGTMYSSGLAASGGVSPYTYSIVSGSLPGGLNLNTGLGTIAGTSTGTGTFSFTGKVVDASSSSMTANCSITIAPASSGGSIWSNAATPATPLMSSSPVNVGVKFRSDASGFINGMRFYKGTGNNGTHIASLYTAAGSLLAQATFSGETPSGWQDVSFAAPVSIGTNTTYIASLFTSSGFPVDYGYFTGRGVDNAPLHALASGVEGGNGVYTYSAGPQVPLATYSDSNYWVDIRFTTSGTPPPLSVGCPSASAVVAAPYNSVLVASGGTSPYTYSIALGTLPGGLTLNPSSGTITGTPGAAGNFSFTAQAVDASQTAIWSNCAINVSAGASASSIWSNSVTPGGNPFVNSTPVNVGVKFRSDVGGVITGIKFYKGVGNSGTHTASLYTSAGTLVAQATFSGETASGWQQLNFPSPVSISANTTYIASLFTTSGYAVDYGYFTGTGVDRAPLHALASGVNGGNGVYTYASAPQFPTASYGDSNYWVDIVFSSN
jgi:hypothetical protein